ncbi:MAG TPA: PP2C family protein-serine/threonine phosphatase [Thermoanaerobaculia bacterium]|nr:PP2C family protein-serine/threonine phosphatase [Thermoanaerobaculia bacterium]
MLSAEPAAGSTLAAPAAGGPAATGRPRPRIRWLRNLLLAGGIGFAAGAMVSLQDRGAELAISLAIGTLVGILIMLFARLLFARWDGAIGRLPRRRAAAARAALFAASGLAGWFVVEGLAVLFLNHHFGRGTLVYVTITVGLAVSTGFGFYSFEVLLTRLETSIARLKEVEYAEKELQLARELQSRLLPPPAIDGDGYRVGARNLAARLVAGDFYDSFLLPDGAVGVVVGDVAGKGMAAALIMASVKAMLPLVSAARSAADTLRELNRRLAAELPEREFVALAFARFEPAGGEVELANAGLPDPYLLTAGAPPAPQVVPGPRLPLGVWAEVAYSSLSLRLAPGDRLLLLSDGLAEAPAANGEPLGYGALAGLLAANGDRDGRGEAPLAWVDRLLERVRGATRPALEDDWTALLLERHAPVAGNS